MKEQKGKMYVGVPGLPWEVCDHSCHKEILFSFFFLLSFALFAWVVFCFSFKICFALEGCKRGMLGGGEIGRIGMCDVKTTKNQYIWLWGSPHQEPGNIGG